MCRNNNLVYVFFFFFTEAPEEKFDPRSLYDRLQEQKNHKDMEYEEAHKLSEFLLLRCIVGTKFLHESVSICRALQRTW